MFAKILLYFLIALFLGCSIVYEIYSVDRQLFHIHKIPRGDLTIPNDLINTFQKITGSSPFKIIINDQLDGKGVKFEIESDGFKLLSVDGQNFMGLVKAEGDIKSHGDSFYQIKDQHQIICNQQIIKRVELVEGILKMEGQYSDCQNSQYEITLSMKSEGKVQATVKSKNQEYNRVLVYFEHKNDNNYYGLGEQFSYLNLGHNRPYSLFVRQKGVGRTDQPQSFFINLLYGASGSYYNSYSPAPIWYSISSTPSPKTLAYFVKSWGYCIWINNQIYIWDTEFTIDLFYSSSVKEVVKMVIAENGCTPPVPAWVNDGAIVGLQGGTQAVMKKYIKLKSSGTKITGLWLQDWVSKRKSLGFSRLWWNWELDKNHYRNWNLMVEQLQKQNVSVLIYINPMLTSVANRKPNYTTNFYQKAVQQNCFITQKEGKIYETSAFSDWSAALIDFNKAPNANKFYQQILREAIKQTGARGLMVDFGQAYPVEAMNGTLEDAVKQHNLYPTAYHQIVREVLDQFKDRQIYTFSRAGYLYAPKYTLSLWAGDQSMNFKKHTGLPSCLTAMLSSSLVGYSNTHCDIGGYSSYELPFQKTSVRTEILMTRWMQLGAFSPVFRTHEGNLPDKSLQVYSNNKIATQFSFYSQIFSTLSKYRSHQSQKSPNFPLIRPFFLQNEQNPESHKITDQYYLGEEMLVSPILTVESKRKIMVPLGKWVNIWDGGLVEGCDCWVEARGFLPVVLVKEGAVDKDEIVLGVKQIIEEFKDKIQYLRQSPQIRQLPQL